MMNRISSFHGKDKTFTSSIAFWPSIISFSFFLLALGMLYFESTSISAAIERNMPFELAKQPDNARLILNTIAGGIISLTVFSFSMVMIVLSQASSNFTPRVIPGLTTVKAHQVVLGFYIGTIIYTLLLLLSFRSENGDTQSVPSIGILVGLMFGIICLTLFVYFIHSISKAIQVDNILNKIYQRTKVALEQEIEIASKSKSETNVCFTGIAYTLISNRDGYLKEVDLDKILKLAQQHDLQLEILVELGSFIVTGTPLLRLTSDVNPHKDLQTELEDCFLLNIEEIVMEDYQQGVRQISEIAVKALSPGINDPGTAVKAIDFLTLLFIFKLRCKDHSCLLDEQQQVRVVDYVLTMDELLHRYLSPIRIYGKQDILINVRLLRCLMRMLQQKISPELKTAIAMHAQAVIADAGNALKSKLDRQRINETIKELNSYLSREDQLAFLDV